MIIWSPDFDHRIWRIGRSIDTVLLVFHLTLMVMKFQNYVLKSVCVLKIFRLLSSAMNPRSALCIEVFCLPAFLGRRCSDQIVFQNLAFDWDAALIPSHCFSVEGVVSVPTKNKICCLKSLYFLNLSSQFKKWHFPSLLFFLALTDCFIWWIRYHFSFIDNIKKQPLYSICYFRRTI